MAKERKSKVIRQRVELTKDIKIGGATICKGVGFVGEVIEVDKFNIKIKRKDDSFSWVLPKDSCLIIDIEPKVKVKAKKAKPKKKVTRKKKK